MMEMIESFSDFLNKMGAHHFLTVGIVIIVLWLLISGFRKGLKRGGREKEPDDNDRHNSEE